jgi:predicted metal-dependent phosphoesterase TrpH
LTDHDTWAGHDEVVAAMAGTSIRILKGLELTAQTGRRRVHLLVYGVGTDDRSAELSARLEQLREGRRIRVREMCDLFASRFGIVLDADAILARGQHGSTGRPHVAAALVAAGACRSVREAFDRFLHDGGPADIPAPRLEVEDAVALAQAAGTRVSLAHPHVVGSPETVRDLCARWKPIGLEGIEAEYGPYAERVRVSWRKVADALGLVVTAGSDYHGQAVLPDVFRPGVSMTEDRALGLCEWLGVA